MLGKYECVVIPNFGGFISHYQGAQILAEKSLILPPSKSLTFNSLLNKNDGLLAQELVLKFGLSYKEAIRVIDIQVDKWLAELTISSAKVQLSTIGNFVQNKKGSFIFTQDNTTNSLAESYGLGVIKAQVLKKDGITGKLKEELVQRQTSPVFNQKVRKLVISSAAAAVFALMFVWSYANIDVVQNQAESLGLLFSSEQVDTIEETSLAEQLPGDAIEVNTTELNTRSATEDISNESSMDSSKSPISELRNDLLTLDNQSINNILTDNLSSSETNEEKTDLSTELNTKGSTVNENKVELDNETKIDNTKVETIGGDKSDEELHSGKYIVVAGCFRSLRNATNFVNELKSLGYEAHLSGYSVKGLYRVAYGSYDNHSEGLKSMRWIQSTHNAQAWMTRR